MALKGTRGLIDDTTTWSAFRSRCLVPVEACEPPILDGLAEDNTFIHPSELRDDDRAFVSPTRDWAIIIGGYEHKDAWYQSVRLERARGVEDQELLDHLRTWSRKCVKEGRYMRGSSDAKGTFSRRTTGWRDPALEIYSFPPRGTNGRYIQLWESHIRLVNGP